MPREALGSVRGDPIGPVASPDGTPIHVESLGEGPTLILSHGFCQDIAMWHYTIKDLARDHRVVAYSHRGHGLSGRAPADDYSIETMAADLHAVVEHVSRGEPLTVLGHSLGGMSLLAYCGLYGDELGERVGAIGLIDTTAADVVGGMLPEGVELARPALALIEQAAVRAAARNPHAFDRIRRARADLVSTLIRLMGFGERAPRYKLAFVERMMSSVAPDVLVWIVQEMRRMDVSAHLDDIHIPALVAVGTRDRLTPVRAARRIAVEIPNAELITIPGAGHMPMLEQPAVFNARLRTFLANPGAVYAGRRVGARRAPD